MRNPDYEALGYALTKVAYQRNQIPALLLLARICAGLTQVKVSEQMGWSTAMNMWLIEKGHRRATVEEGARLAEIYGIPFEWISHECAA